ncbi:hypothetical protein DEH69_26520 [Streptomyces sp. PT12]|nr:hypothetical protein DEH69_26520 [Streptomyces sp. PT12]
MIVAGPGQLRLWSAVLSDDREADVHVIPLRRFTASGLRSWALEMNAFTTEAELDRLLETTGGWPILVDGLADQLRKHRSADQALRAVSERLSTPHGAAGFLQKAGLEPSTPLWRA